LRDPVLLFRLLKMVVFILFISEMYKCILLMEGKPEGYIFDWLTYFKSSRNLILFGTLSIMSWVWEGFTLFWGKIVGWN
jgi:hypothetical protein